VPSKQPALILVSFRVATTQVFRTETTRDDWRRVEAERVPQKKDYLGLPSQQKHWSVIEEAIVDFPVHSRKRISTLRLLHNQLFVATYCKILPAHVDLSQRRRKQVQGNMVERQSIPGKQTTTFK
jgi:hypothetical protein